MRRTRLKPVLLLVMLSLPWVYLPSFQTMSFAKDGPWTKVTFYVHYDPALITIERMEEALTHAGTYIGTVK
jgi:hypothetical protein